MDALLMCGGEGTRLDAPVEKPLLEVGGRRMVDRVADALAASRIGTAYAVVSPAVPDTGVYVDEDLDLPTVETPGEGYVADLDRALDAVDCPVLTVAADLPLLSGATLDAVLDVYAGRDGGSLTMCVPVALKRRLGTSVGSVRRHDGRAVTPTGVNVVGSGSGTGADAVHVSEDSALAVNVNEPTDAAVAEGLL